MDNKDQVIQQFMELTAADNDVATFYLESAKWDIEAAVTSYYGNDTDDQDYHEDHIDQANVDLDINESSDSKGLNNLNAIVNQSVSKSSQPQGKIMTLSSIKRADSDDENEERGQAFYVGGSERGGGQQVLGPPRQNKNKNTDKIQDLFKSAQLHGAEVIDSQYPDSEVTGSSKAFTGSGCRLDGENAFDIRSNDDSRGQSQPIKVNVKIWSNGFSIDDGPLRSLTEPNDIAFLRSLSTGQIPTELLQQHKYAKIDLNMEDHSSDEYRAPPKPKVVPFQGAGQMLGSPVPKIICEPAKSSQITSSVSPINVDENKPVTQIQIRLADNSRLVVRLNHNHTVGDLKKHIISQHSQYQLVNFNLMTTFPNKILTDDSITIQEANLLNAVIVQRLV